jgi:hypothetical protein
VIRERVKASADREEGTVAGADFVTLEDFGATGGDAVVGTAALLSAETEAARFRPEVWGDGA